MKTNARIVGYRVSWWGGLPSLGGKGFSEDPELHPSRREAEDWARAEKPEHAFRVDPVFETTRRRGWLARLFGR